MELMIANKIKKLRKDKELTQEALANVLGVSPQSISKWECGDGYPDITLLPSIANYFEITVDELIGNDEISAKEDIQKNYFNVEWTLDKEERLQLALKYNKKYPRNWHIANSLMYEISRHHRNKINEYKQFLYDLCERILKECSDSVMRRDAITSICMICEEDEIVDWLNRDTTFWYEKRDEVYEERYRLTKDKEQYEMYQNANSFLYVSRMLSTLENNRNYIGKPEKAIEWNQSYIHLLNAVSDYNQTKMIPDGWLSEYATAYMRLSAAYFGAKNKEIGYEYLEKAFALAKQYHSIPNGTALSLGKPILYGDTQAIKNDDSIILRNGKSLANFQGISEFDPCIAQIMEAKSGWEWFNSVRHEDRYLAILENAKKIAE